MEENTAILEALRAHDEAEASAAQPTLAAPAPAEPVIETVPEVADLGIPTPPPAVVVAPIVIATPAAPAADPAPAARPASTSVDNDAIVAAFEAQRRRNEARLAAQQAANDDVAVAEPAARVQREAARPAPRTERRPSVQPAADLKVPTTPWLRYLGAALLAIALVLGGWWLLKDRHSDGVAPQPAAIAADTTPALAPSTQVVDETARKSAAQANAGVGITQMALSGVAQRVTTLENSQDGQRGMRLANVDQLCSYPNLGACVVDQTARQGISLQAQGLVNADQVRGIVTQTCRELGCVE